MEEFIDRMDRYIRWYNERHIKPSVAGVSPVENRQAIRKAALISPRRCPRVQFSPGFDKLLFLT
jgi:hypothetical protein